MFDLEMVKRNFPFEKKFGLRKFLVQDNVDQNFILPKALKCHV